MSAAPLSASDMHRCLDSLRADFSTANVINRRGDRVVIRWHDPVEQRSIILKMWARSTLKIRLRRALRITPSHYEWRNLQRLGRLGVPVPRALGFCRLAPRIADYTEALFTEDLGDCESATEHLKRLIASSQDEAAKDFEDRLIEMTHQLVDAGMLDDDHGLLNIVVPPSGHPVRLDLELCRHVRWPRLLPRAYGRMLGRFIGLHAFAVQPDVRRTVDFARRLRERLAPPAQVLRHASEHVRGMMAQQLRVAGIDTRFALPWDQDNH